MLDPQAVAIGVLAQAFSDLARWRRARVGTFAPLVELEHWLADRSEAPQSFAWWCAVAGLDADVLRDGLHRAGPALRLPLPPARRPKRCAA